MNPELFLNVYLIVMIIVMIALPITMEIVFNDGKRLVPVALTLAGLYAVVACLSLVLNFVF